MTKEETWKKLKKIGFVSVDMPKGKWYLMFADLKGANLRKVNLSEVDLSLANLSGANLIEVDLRGANLRGADLSKANLRGADLGEDDLWGINLLGADLREAEEALEELQAGPDPDDVIAAQARVDAAQAIVDQSKLIAPFAGTVMSIHVRLGDSVVPGQEGVVVADLATLHIDTLVDELDLASIEIGQDVNITLDAIPEANLGGQVEEIDLAPVSGSDTIEYPVKIRLDSVDGDVRIGMTAALNILVAHKDDILLVPNWALRLEPETGEIYVTVLQSSGEGRRVPLVLGLRNEAFSEVISGLSGGEQVGIVLTAEPEGFRGPFGGR